MREDAHSAGSLHAGSLHPPPPPVGVESLMTEWARPGPAPGWEAPAAAPGPGPDVDPFARLLEAGSAALPTADPLGSAAPRARPSTKVVVPAPSAQLVPWRRDASRPAAAAVPAVLATAGLLLAAYLGLFVGSAPLAVLSALLGVLGGLFCRVLLKG